MRFCSCYNISVLRKTKQTRMDLKVNRKEVILMTRSCMNNNWARERLFNYNIELHDIRNRYTYAIGKEERDGLKSELDTLQKEIEEDEILQEEGINLLKFLGKKKENLDSQLIKLMEFMGNSWELLSVCK